MSAVIRFGPRLSLKGAPLWSLFIGLCLILAWAAYQGGIGLQALTNGSAPMDQVLTIWAALRLPRLLLGLMVGAMLAASGTAMQGLFRNPLADPTLLGMASGAGLAVAIWIVFFQGFVGDWGLYGQFGAGFLGALVVSLLVFTLGQGRASGDSLLTLLLAGLAITALASAGGGLLAFLANDEQLRQLSLWGMGSLTQSLWPPVVVGLVLMPVAAWGLWRRAGDLDLLQLGDLTAHGAGLDIPRLRRSVVLWSALGVGLCVALSGIIGFVGLLVPHALRLWLGPGHRLLLPASMLGGAALLVCADMLARSLAPPAELPVGVLTSLIGGPYFLWLLVRGQRHAQA
ncbi:iron ABC transporter [Terasakiispira papahanaumokuakeensis]|uniref:Iron ABC transporter n=1 Tax=Terasakiispira papahanaumokuakeensis TaxID=197479 RepID=A0A1E2VBT6_9GAMM|nr:iron ABC transporter permease [Terasakiispira papahanaumokuakeensis]ODC04449.1 iron ABC transporter [Terasakiispira papahanaumokuakeensis]